MESIVEKIRISLAEVLNLQDFSTIQGSTRLSEDLDLDSSLFIQLLMTIEDHIPGLMFDPQTLKREDFLSVENLASYIHKVTVSA